jgi:hypothetical protein
MCRQKLKIDDPRAMSNVDNMLQAVFGKYRWTPEAEISDNTASG